MLTLQYPYMRKLRRLYYGCRPRAGVVAGDGPIYGELRLGSFHNIVLALQKYTNIDQDSIFLDIGSGLGKPCVHVAYVVGCRCVGIEIVGARWRQSLDSVSAAKRVCKSFPTPLMLHADMRSMESLSPFTHVFAFDSCYTSDDLCTLLNLFNNSTCTALVSFCNPKKAARHGLHDCECPVTIQVRMRGSGERHTAYIYRKTGGTRTQLQLPPVPDNYSHAASYSDALSTPVDEWTMLQLKHRRPTRKRKRKPPGVLL